MKLPSADVPVSSNTCEIHLINTTTNLLCKSSSLVQPVLQGHEFLNLPTFAFYIHNPRLNKRILFDMGSRKDWWNLPPVVTEAIEAKGVPGIQIDKDISDILSAGGVDPQTIDAVVWSHYHWDHVGNIQKFPPSTDIVVASGFKQAFTPGYPTNAASPFYDADFTGRTIHEINFSGGSQSLKIGHLHAFDYFGDQSFYILSTPGHTAGHVSGLVRTTADTFVFLGGDISHFPGTYRPTAHLPMPDTIPPETKLDRRIPRPCPCSLFTACHPRGPSQAQTTPYYDPASGDESWYDDAAEAKKSIDGMAEFDADENVFVAIAHDPALQDVCEQFPHATMNQWKAKGWKVQAHWSFLNELPVGGKPGRDRLVDGRFRDGVRVG
ncbi:Nn.00g048680.m01.CDS01 [Neocucurbitaria sp. VM-36]